MKRFVSKILLFIVFVAIFNILYLQYLKRYSEGFKKTAAVYNMKNNSYDCIILGNSVAYDGIDAEFLTNRGISSYNFALGGENLKSNYIQIEHYLNNNKKPKIVLLGLSPSTPYSSSRTDTSIHPIVAYNYNRLNKFDFKNIPMIKFQWLAVEFFKSIASKAYRNAIVVQGQLRTDKTIPDNTNYSSTPKQEIVIKDYLGAKYLFKIDSLCEANSIDFIALGMPGYRETQNEAPIGIHTLEYDNGTIIKILNMNNKELCSNLFDSQKDWLGNSHLNKYGALKLTKHLYREYLIIYNTN